MSAVVGREGGRGAAHPASGEDTEARVHNTPAWQRWDYRPPFCG